MPKTERSRTATVNIRLGANMKETVKQYAQARDMTVGEFVRYALWTYMDSTPIDDEIDGEEGLAPPEARAGRPIELGKVKRG